jgi:hypothetical protein
LAWIAAANRPARRARTTNQARISKSGYTIRALALLAGKDWEFFTAKGFDTELTLMQ